MWPLHRAEHLCYGKGRVITPLPAPLPLHHRSGRLPSERGQTFSRCRHTRGSRPFRDATTDSNTRRDQCGTRRTQGTLPSHHSLLTSLRRGPAPHAKAMQTW
jgi:hypothetical protein